MHEKYTEGKGVTPDVVRLGDGECGRKMVEGLVEGSAEVTPFLAESLVFFGDLKSLVSSRGFTASAKSQGKRELFSSRYIPRPTSSS